jgi:hypothetical protein
MTESSLFSIINLEGRGFSTLDMGFFQNLKTGLDL